MSTNPFGTSDDSSSSSVSTVNVDDNGKKMDRRKSANPFIGEDDAEEMGNDNIVAVDRNNSDDLVLATVTLASDEEDCADNKASRRKSTNPWGYGEEESGESDKNNSQCNSVEAQREDRNEVWEAEGTIISDITEMDHGSVFSGWRTGEMNMNNNERRISQPLVFKSNPNGSGYFLNMKDAPEDVKEYNLDSGYWDGSVYEAIYNECDKSHVGARIELKKRIIAAHEKNDVVTLDAMWRSPISVRVSSWLPNIEDPDSKEMHTGYFATVYLTSRPTHQWQVIARFGKFYNLYSRMKKSSYEKLFPGGMTCPFPDDRWRTKFFGVNDDTRSGRQKALDGWFRELVTSPKVMLDANLRKYLFEFLEVEKNKTIAGEIQVLSKRDQQGASAVGSTAFTTGSSIAKRMSGPIGSQSAPPRPYDVPLGY